MTDALCGPSNPLQNIQKQTSVDRTLQQDRLHSRHSPLEGFRSPGPNAGILDPEFEAFQNSSALPPPNLQQALPYTFQDALQPHPAFPKSSAGPLNWVADFQRLALSSPPPNLQQDASRFQSPPQQSEDLGWDQEFIKQNIPQAHGVPTHSRFMPEDYNPMGLGMNQGPLGFNNNFAPQAFTSPVYGTNPTLQLIGNQAESSEIFQRQFEDLVSDQNNRVFHSIMEDRETTQSVLRLMERQNDIINEMYSLRENASHRNDHPALDTYLGPIKRNHEGIRYTISESARRYGTIEEEQASIVNRVYSEINNTYLLYAKGVSYEAWNFAASQGLTETITLSPQKILALHKAKPPQYFEEWVAEDHPTIYSTKQGHNDGVPLREPAVTRIGADTIDPSPQSSAQEPGQADPTELSKTAGRLLDTVKDNQSSKFQQSDFLALMKKLRDKEVILGGVNGTEFVPATEDLTMHGGSGPDDLIHLNEYP